MDARLTFEVTCKSKTPDLASHPLKIKSILTYLLTYLLDYTDGSDQNLKQN